MPDDISVLYIDDEPNLLTIAKIFLESMAQFRVGTSESPLEALELLKTTPFDAIITDYMMPEMDGIEFLKALRKSGNTTPVILFTGRGREEVVIQALNEGADSYIQKGGNPQAQFAELAQRVSQTVFKQRTEIALANSERRLRDIINFLPDATFAIDTRGIIIAWNRAIEELTGLTSTEMVGKGDFEYAIPFYGEKRPILIDLISVPTELVKERYAGIVRSENTLAAETRYSTIHGEKRTLWAKASQLYDQNGKVAGAIETIRDITDRIQEEQELKAAYEQLTAAEEELRSQYDALATSEQQLRKSEDILADRERKVRAVFNSTFQFTGMMTADGILIDANQTALSFIGATLEDVAGRPFWETPWWKGDEKRVNRLREAIREAASGKFVRYEVMFTGLRKNTIYYDFSVKPIFEPDGSIRYLIPEARDITAIREVELALRESEALFRSLFDQASQLAGILNLEGILTRVNSTAIAMIGKDASSVLNKPFWETPWWAGEPTQQEQVKEAIARARNGGASRFEATHKDHEGKVHYIDFSLKPVLDDSGKVIALLPEGRDITEIREAGQHIQLLASLNDISPALIIIHTPEGQILYANQRAYEVHGWTREEFLALNLHTITTPETERLIEPRIKELAEKGELSMNVDHFRKDGSTVSLHVNAKITRWNDRTVVMSVLTANDPCSICRRMEDQRSQD